MLAALLFGQAFAGGAEFFQPQAVGYLSRGSMVSRAVPVPLAPPADSLRETLELAAPSFPRGPDPDARDEHVSIQGPAAVSLILCSLALAGAAMRKPIVGMRVSGSPSMSASWGGDEEERSGSQRVLRGPADQVFRNKAMAYVVIFNPGTAKEGVYTLETGVGAGGTKAYLLTFENAEDAQHYARRLQGEDFNVLGRESSVSLAAQSLMWDARRISQFCYSSDFEVALVPAGGTITPPESNTYDPARFGHRSSQPEPRSWNTSRGASPSWQQGWQSGGIDQRGYDQRAYDRRASLTSNQKRGQSVWAAAMRNLHEPRGTADPDLCGVEECGFEEYVEERGHLENIYDSDSKGL